ncbi:MAG TPA: hypothetical protein VFX42_06155 [Gemmatimonadales bacterium]|nr:hypothetical protein [Gemmatimonadales bacterium]
MPFDVSFAEADRMRADREAKKRDLVDRLTALLVKNFDASELRFAWFCEGDAVRIEAYERARAELVRG